MCAYARACSRRRVPSWTSFFCCSSASTIPYSAGSTTTVTDSAFFAAERIIDGPPMSMFSITSPNGSPFCTASRKG